MPLMPSDFGLLAGWAPSEEITLQRDALVGVPQQVCDAHADVVQLLNPSSKPREASDE
ncbi:MAG: hypothetical protein AAF479_07710 [Pseudomonadota bacterium]